MMTIIGLFYLLLIMGWILLILFLKCKRARAKRLAEEQAAEQAAQQCHVIQIGSNYYDIIPVTSSTQSCNNYRSCLNSANLQQLEDIDNNNNLQIYGSQQSLATSRNHNRHHNTRSSSRASDQTHSNPAFIMDETGVFPSSIMPDLPPSYEDVMRLPSSYPKVAPFTPQYDQVINGEQARNTRNQQLHSVDCQFHHHRRNNTNNTNNNDEAAVIEVTSIENHMNNLRNSSRHSNYHNTNNNNNIDDDGGGGSDSGNNRIINANTNRPHDLNISTISNGCSNSTIPHTNILCS